MTILKNTIHSNNTLFNEIIVDNFAGGGGTSMGIYAATGRNVDIAINHDPSAIAMHQANHPATKHYCESVWDVDPEKAVEGQPVGLCWLSPDCTHFSKARSARPVSKNIRGLAWVAIRWAATVKPRILMLENVEEFKTWGPVNEETGQPCAIRKGETFDSFKQVLSTGLGKKHPSWRDVFFQFFENNYNVEEKLKIYKAVKHGCGYKVEFKELRACDYGAPTIRKRLFMIARRDGHPIVWPTATHGDPASDSVKKGKLKPWRSASECINWSIPCQSIFLSKAEAKKVNVRRPLAENTMKRIYKGLKKYVLESESPYFVPSDKIINKASGLRHKFVQAFLTEHANASSQRVFDVNTPLRTQMASVKGGHFALVTSHVIKMRNGNFGSQMQAPLHTVTSGGLHMGEVRAFLVKYYGNEKSGIDITDPMHTVTTKDRLGIVTVNSNQYIIADIGMRMLQPRELFTAQGFPEDYIIDVGANEKKSTKTEQVARCGNAVPPQFSEALVRANLPEMCNVQHRHSA